MNSPPISENETSSHGTDGAWRQILFEQSVQPAWIYDRESLAFLDVNQAAIKHYGYSREQFLEMTLREIRPPEDVPALLDNIATLDADLHVSGEWRHLCADGTVRYSEVASYNFEFGGKLARLAVVNDVTERHLAEEALKRTVQDYRGLFENAHDAILILAADDEIVLDVNQRACEIYGFSRSEFIGMSVISISKDVERGKQHMQQTLERGVCYHFETVQYRKDGSEMILEINASVITYKGQRAVMSINRDVTERERAQDALRREGQKRLLHVERTPLGVIEWNPEFRITAWNPGAERIFGYAAHEVVGEHAVKLLPPAARDHVAEVFRELLATKGGLRSTNRNITKDGRTILCEWYNTPLIDTDGNVIAVASLVEDVTEREQVRGTLEVSEENYRTLAEAVPAMVYSGDGTGMVNYFNSRWFEYTGLNRDDSAGLSWVTVVHPDDMEGMMLEWSRCADAGITYEQEFRLRRSDGEYRWFLARSVPIRDASGQIVRWLGTSTDIDDLKRAQAELHRQKALLQAIFDHIPVMTSFRDSSGKPLMVNRAYEQTFGYSLQDILAQDLLPQVYPEPTALAEVQDFILRGDHSWKDFRPLTRDGRVIETSWTNVRLEDGQILALGIDVTQRRADERALLRHTEALNDLVQQRTKQIIELERQRADADKLLATARVAARIAHEILNPLNSLSTAFILVRDAVPKDDQYFPYVEKIQREIDRISRITKQMYRAFKTETEPATCFDLVAAVEDVICSLRDDAVLSPVPIEVSKAIPADRFVELPEQAVRQILINIIRNAAEASPAGANVEIEIGATDAMVSVRVSDRGAGIDDAIADQVFEPFFTTKNTMPSSGLGLGLSIANGLARAMEGSIAFEAREGGGAIFTISLPRRIRPKQNATASKPGAKPE